MLCIPVVVHSHTIGKITSPTETEREEGCMVLIPSYPHALTGVPFCLKYTVLNTPSIIVSYRVTAVEIRCICVNEGQKKKKKN